MEEYILNSLNEEQREAVQTTEGYIRVIAGAGSGKTRALVHRYVYLVNELGISTANILCVTFTNKAANEMKSRIRSMIGDNDLGLICTFHGFCVRLLREDVFKIRLPKNFIILDGKDTESILKNVYVDSEIRNSELTYRAAKSYISTCKRVTKYNEYIQLLIDESDTNLINKYNAASAVTDKIFYRYIYEQKKCYGLDFDDLILVSLYILETFSDVRLKWQQKLEYIMVDEFQDVSHSQYDLCRILNDFHKNLFVVGDPDQTIYSWRGADVNILLNFDTVFKNTKTIMMVKNYRSYPEILNVANSLISKNNDRIDKQLLPVLSGGTITLYNHASSVYNESNWISDQIKLLREQQINWNDIAILYRSHYVSHIIEEAFRENKIPYVIYSGVGFYERKEIKDVISYLRMLTSADDLSFLRTVNTPPRNIGKRRIDFIKNYANNHKCTLYQALQDNLHQSLFKNTKADMYIYIIEKYRRVYHKKTITNLTEEMLDISGYEAMLRTKDDIDRLDNIAELKQSIMNYENEAGEDVSLEDYLEKISLYTNMDNENKENTVKLMTVHAAKGLEFPYVFVCELNDGIFPTRRADTLPKLEEERRLAYVAITRAKKALFLSDAGGIYYDGMNRYPSRFIYNIEDKYLKYCVELDAKYEIESQLYIAAQESAIKNKANEINNMTLSIGNRIFHKHFGNGIITDIDIVNKTITVQFDNIASKRTINMSANIDKIINKENANNRHCPEFCVNSKTVI